METHRPSSTVRIPTRPLFDAGRRPSTSRSPSYTSTASTHSRSPMPIPGRPIDEPPPPLPPPRYNEEFEQGIDRSWDWSNAQSHHREGTLAPIKSSSSLYGGYMCSRDDVRRLSDPDEMDVDGWEDRRGSAALTIRSSSQADTRFTASAGAPGGIEIAAGSSIPSLVRRPPSPASSNQR
jgi:hypothetical protein